MAAGPRAAVRASPERVAGLPARLRDTGSGLERSTVVALVVITIRARADRLPPPGVVPVPIDRPLQTLLEPHLSLPAQRAEPVRGQRVAPVVTRPIGHVLDQRLVAPCQREDPLDDVD